MTSSPNVSSSLSIQIDQASQATKLLMLLALFSLFSASKCCPSCPMSPGSDWNFDWLFRAATQRSWLLSTVIAVVLHPDSPNALTFCCEWCFPMCPFRIVFVLHLGKEGTDGNGCNPQEEGSLTKRVLATDRWFREFSSKPFLFSLSMQCATRSRFKNTTALPAWKLCNCIYTRPCAGTQFPFKAVWMSYAKARMTEILSNSTGQALKNLERHWWSELGEQNCSISLALCGAQCVTDMWSILIHYVIQSSMAPWYTDIYIYLLHVLVFYWSCRSSTVNSRSLAVASAPRLKAPAPNASAKTCERHKVERHKPLKDGYIDLYI